MKKTFSLSEFMIIIAIISILAGISLPNVLTYRDKAKTSMAQNERINTSSFKQKKHTLSH